MSPTIAASPSLNTSDKVSTSEMLRVTSTPMGVRSKKLSFRPSRWR